jgi:hypothetical protein
LPAQSHNLPVKVSHLQYLWTGHDPADARVVLNFVIQALRRNENIAVYGEG